MQDELNEDGHCMRHRIRAHKAISDIIKEFSNHIYIKLRLILKLKFIRRENLIIN